MKNKDPYSKMRSFMAKHAPEKMSAEDLKEEGDRLYYKKLDEEERLLELYKQKKLTNKDAIRKARAILQRYTEKDKVSK